MVVDFGRGVFWTRGSKTYQSPEMEFDKSVKNTMVINMLGGADLKQTRGTDLPCYCLGIEDIETDAGEIAEGIEELIKRRSRGKTTVEPKNITQFVTKIHDSLGHDQ